MADEQPITLEALLGIEGISSTLHESSKRYFLKLLEAQPVVTIPDFAGKEDNSHYLRVREQLAKSVALAAMVGDARLEVLVSSWVSLQQGYARQVIAGSKAGVKDQIELIAVADKELVDGEKERTAYAELGKRPAMDLSDSDLAKLTQLRAKIAQLDLTARTREALHRQVAGVERVEQTLTTLIEQGVGGIHYVIPSVKEIQDRLGANTFDGPDFQPFLISSRATVSDIFLREQLQPRFRQPAVGDARTPSGLNMEKLPPLLAELVRVYEHVADQAIGTLITPTLIVSALNLEHLGAKGIASYLEDNGALFGVRKRESSGSRTFTRYESGSSLDGKEFLTRILDGQLQGQDARPVNGFYFNEVLALLRELPEAYIGFTVESVKALAKTNHIPLTGIYIARNMHTNAVEWDLREIEPATKTAAEKYIFATVKPTHRQLTYIQEALREFGVNRFMVDDLVGTVQAKHTDYRLSKKVAEEALRLNHKGWEYRVASNEPLYYQKETSSAQTGRPPEQRRVDGRLG